MAFFILCLIIIGIYLFYNYSKAKKNIAVSNELRTLCHQRGIPSNFFTYIVNNDIEDIKLFARLYQNSNPEQSWATSLADAITARYQIEVNNGKKSVVIEVLKWYKSHNLMTYSSYYKHTVIDIFLSENPDVVDKIYDMDVFDVGCISNFDGIDTRTITKLPEFLKKLPNLKAIVMGSASMSEIYSVSLGELDLDLLIECSELQEVHLQYCDIRSIKFSGDPKKSKLKALKLGGNALTHIPESICNLKSLEVLTLWGNPLKELPLKIGDLSNLKGLDISDTDMVFFPKSIINLNLKNFYYDEYEISLSSQEQIWMNKINLYTN